jgi:hypothetical protein
MVLEATDLESVLDGELALGGLLGNLDLLDRGVNGNVISSVRHPVELV